MTLRVRATLAAVVGVLVVSAAGAARAEYLPRVGAVLQGLDKITARVTELEIRNGETANFHGLRIAVASCFVRPPEEPPEAAAFIDIVDDEARPAVPLFRGWMFASSPAVSPFEHPVYDIRVLRCLAD